MGTGYPEYKFSYIHDRLTIAVLGGIWHHQKLDYNVTNQLIYRGVNEVHGASDDSTDWEVWKFTYDVNGNVTLIEGPLRGSWTNRATLSWV